MSLVRTLIAKSGKAPNELKINRILYTLNHKFFATKSHDASEGPPTKSQDEAEEDSKPIVYSKSPASRWQAKFSRMGTDMDRLWYEPYVILGSLTVFMVYFCILRDESDVDKEFDKTLYNRIRGLEEKQLYLTLEYNLQHGLETKEIESRLKEITESKRNL